MNDKLKIIIDQLKTEFKQNFRQDDSYTWRFEVFTESGRSQVVTLLYKEQFYSGQNISRFITFSAIGPIFREFNYEYVLRKNCQLDIGTIGIEDLKNQENIKVPYLIFRATHLFVTADYLEIWELIVKTGEYADKLEQNIYSKDNH